MRIERLILREAIESTGKPLRTGGSTFYVRNGKLCVQSSTRPEHSGKNWKRTPARTKSNRRFAALRNVSTYLKEVYAGLPVWEVAKAKLSRTMTVENYLMSVMTPYFDEKGEVRDFEGIPLSEGGLVPPSGLRAEYAGGVVTLRWNVGEDEARARHADTLQAVWVREARAGHVGRVAPAALAGEADGSGSHPAARAGSAEEDGARAATRGDGAASFAMGLNPGDRLHIYPFFAAEDMSDFSRNGHIVVEINDEG